MRPRIILLLYCFLSIFTLTHGQIDEEDETYFKELIEKYDIPGISIAVVENYEISYVNAFGRINSREEEKIDENTLFQAASISKSLTGVLFLRYAQQHKIDLDVSINDYLKGWKLEPYKKDKTLVSTSRDLLSHTGGTNIGGFMGYHSAQKYLPSLDEVLNGEKGTHIWEPKIVTKYPPKEGFRYSGGGYTVLQKAICDLSGKDFHTAMKEEVFDPIGMESSFFELAIEEQNTHTFSHGHKKSGKPVKSNFYRYPQLAAAGLWTTPTDLAKLLISIMRSAKHTEEESENLLTPASISEMITKPELANGSTSAYGLGFGLISDEDGKVVKIRHSGSNWGFACVMYANLTNGKAVVVMMNRHKMALWPFTDRINEKIDF